MPAAVVAVLGGGRMRRSKPSLSTSMMSWSDLPSTSGSMSMPMRESCRRWNCCCMSGVGRKASTTSSHCLDRQGQWAPWAPERERRNSSAALSRVSKATFCGQISLLWQNSQQRLSRDSLIQPLEAHAKGSTEPGLANQVSGR